MTGAEIAAILKMANLALNLATKAGANIQQFQDMRAAAEAEGRQLTDDELQGLADDSQAAIDRLAQ